MMNEEIRGNRDAQRYRICARSTPFKNRMFKRVHDFLHFYSFNFFKDKFNHTACKSDVCARWSVLVTNFREEKGLKYRTKPRFTCMVVASLQETTYFGSIYFLINIFFCILLKNSFHGFPNNLATYGLVSGLWTSIYALEELLSVLR